MLIDKKVQLLRRQMRKNKLAAFIINGTDPHKSEYVCDRWQAREWISGFTGSAGTVVVTDKQALIWVDSRYYVQCKAQIKGTCFEMRKIDGPEATSPVDFIVENIKKERVGISAETLMLSTKRSYKDKGINIVPCADLLDKIWDDRPSFPDSKVVTMPVKFSGESLSSKVARIREAAKKDGADYVLISSLDGIAWTLNLRGNDIEDTPVFLSYLLIGPDDIMLFTSESRELDFDEEQMEVSVLPYEKTANVLKEISGTVALNPNTTNMLIYDALKKCKIVEIAEDYSTNFKACKNPVELEGMRKAHIVDGVALVNFMAKVEARTTSYTEVSIAKLLEDERKKSKDYLGPSFSTIAGFADHGAVVHYSATEETDKAINGSGLLVLDSGGQYPYGTTDITRTLLFGRPTKEQKEDYTLVLKGHLALANSVYPKGTSGHQLDVLAHRPLWQYGMTYFHGTGHGVGHHLSVHEGPHRISTYPSNVALEPGMVVSDEPGVYKEGKHGIRIENLIAVKEHLKNEFGTFYAFETLTCCPYELKLIEKNMLTAGEIKKVNAYHKWVWDTLKGLVSPEGKEWLKKATMPL